MPQDRLHDGLSRPLEIDRASAATHGCTLSRVSSRVLPGTTEMGKANLPLLVDSWNGIDNGNSQRSVAVPMSSRQREPRWDSVSDDGLSERLLPWWSVHSAAVENRRQHAAWGCGAIQRIGLARQ